MGEALKRPPLAAQIILSVSLTCLEVGSDSSPIKLESQWGALLLSVSIDRDGSMAVLRSPSSLASLQ